MGQFLTVSQAAQEIGHHIGTEVKPRVISDLFYQRVIPDDYGPVIGDRRLMLRDRLPEITALLRKRYCSSPSTEGVPDDCSSTR